MAEGPVEVHILQRLDLDLAPSRVPELGLQEVTDVRWKPTAAELDAICESHRQWLESDGRDGQNANLSEAHLPHADLSGVVLQDADLTEAFLLDADLSEANLRGADLSGTNLQDADLSEARLPEADLSETHFAGADLSEAFLQKADLSGADAWEADLSGAFLQGAGLSKAHLPRAVLSGASLRNADLSETNLRDAVLSGADLPHTDLSEAHLPHADLSGAVLREADLSGAFLQDANLSEARFRDADLSEARFRKADLSGADLRRADLSRADLKDADLTDVDGLQVGQLRGATVSLAEVPDAIKDFAGLNAAKATTQSAKKLLVWIVLICAFAILAFSAGGTRFFERVEIPYTGQSIRAESFYLISPVLLALLFGYFQLQLQRLWGELAQLPAVFPDGKPLDEKVHPWLITGLVRAHVKRLKERKPPPFFPLQRFIAVLLVWGTVPITLVYFAWMSPVDAGVWGNLLLHVLAALTASGAYVAYRKATHTLDLRKHRSITLLRPDSPEDEVWVFRSTGFWTGVAFLAVAVTVWYVRLHALPW